MIDEQRLGATLSEGVELRKARLDVSEGLLHGAFTDVRWWVHRRRRRHEGQRLGALERSGRAAGPRERVARRNAPVMAAGGTRLRATSPCTVSVEPPVRILPWTLRIT